jgi:CHAT domain-containing protein
VSSRHRTEVRSLLVAEPESWDEDWDVLGGVTKEVAAVAKILPRETTTVIQREDAPPTPTSPSDVIEHLPSASVLHFACHGIQDNSDPLQSAFKLGTGDLTIGQLMKLNLPNALFAYLSACETGKGDPSHPDQVIHLASSLLFAGFRSIIASKWYV